MQPQSNEAVEKITAILRERGDDLNQSDMNELDILSMDIAPDDLADIWPWVMEAVALVVNAPGYEGDIAPIE